MNRREPPHNPNDVGAGDRLQQRAGYGSPGRKCDRPGGDNDFTDEQQRASPSDGTHHADVQKEAALHASSASAMTVEAPVPAAAPLFVSSSTSEPSASASAGASAINTMQDSSRAAFPGMSSHNASPNNRQRSMAPPPPRPALLIQAPASAGHQTTMGGRVDLSVANTDSGPSTSPLHRHGRSKSEPLTWADAAEIAGLKRKSSLFPGPNKSVEISMGSSSVEAMGPALRVIPRATLKPPAPMLQQQQQTQHCQMLHSPQSGAAAAASSSQSSATAAARRRVGRPPDVMRSSKPQSSSDEAAVGATPAEKRSQQIFATRKRKWADKPLDVFMNVRILLQILEREDRKLKLQAVNAVQYCSKRHKAGDPDFSVLSTSVDRTLRMIVGERRWKIAEDCQRKLVAKKVVAMALAGAGTKPPVRTADVGGSVTVGRGHGSPPPPSSNFGDGASAAV